MGGGGGEISKITKNPSKMFYFQLAGGVWGRRVGEEGCYASVLNIYLLAKLMEAQTLFREMEADMLRFRPQISRETFNWPRQYFLAS